MGTWCARQKPSTLCPSISAGAVQPLGLRSTIMGQRGRWAVPLARARACSARISATQRSSTSAIFRCIASGSDPSTKCGVQP